MNILISYEFNMDTTCVELKYSDGTMISIDTIAVENEIADNMVQRSELDWLIYNKPLEYAQLVLGEDLQLYFTYTLYLTRPNSPIVMLSPMIRIGAGCHRFAFTSRI